MPKWTDYTIKTDPADKDEVMILDTAGKANKRLGLSVFSDWILNKLADKTFQKLTTSNKTIIGAINVLNGNSYKDILAVSGTSEQSVAISNQYNNSLMLVLFESDSKVLDMKNIPLSFAIQGKTISVYNPKELSIYAEIIIDKINNTITLKHYGIGFARVYAR